MTRNIKDKLQKIDKDHFSLLVEIGKTAEEEKLEVYLVGGMVRDLLLGFDNLDIDIVVENNARHLAEVLVNKFPNCELSAKHDRFHTAKLIFDLNNKKIPVDLASTREETYDHPAALPTVSVSDLKKDLIRRDFTINALAVSLLPHDFGEVVDLFGGLDDLKNKTIRILHDKSFIDDPTRMIRAIRFAVKLGFEIEPHTKELLDKAISSGQFDNLIQKIRGDRVKIEIRYLFNLQNIEEAIRTLFKSNVYKMVSTELKIPHSACIEEYSISADLIYRWLIYLGLVVKDLEPSDQDKIMKDLQLTSSEMKVIKSSYAAFNKLETLYSKNQKLDPVDVYNELKNLTSESILTTRLLCFDSPAIRKLIDEYLEKTSEVKLEITGQDLIELGVPEGRKIKEILDKVLEAKIKHPDMRKQDEIKEAERFI